MALCPVTGHGSAQEWNMSSLPRRISIMQCSVNKYFLKITGGIWSPRVYSRDSNVITLFRFKLLFPLPGFLVLETVTLKTCL